jgi:hypothetical protein
MARGEVLLTLRGTAGLEALAFLRDARTLAGAQGDRIRLWAGAAEGGGPGAGTDASTVLGHAVEIDPVALT